MARPSRLVRESATTMRYCGLRILPIRRSRILTATVLFAPDDCVSLSACAHVGTAGQTTHGLATRSGLEGASRVHRVILPDRRQSRPIGTNIKVRPKIKFMLS